MFATIPLAKDSSAIAPQYSWFAGWVKSRIFRYLWSYEEILHGKAVSKTA
jgi:hypothetical protein